jgi:hypothetical protein
MWQLVLSLAIAAVAIIIAIPAWQHVPTAYSLPLLLSGALIGMSVTRAELALRRRR